MGKKTVKVESNSKDNSELSRTSAWADRDRPNSRLSSSFRQILVAFSVGQVIMVAVSAATLGAFVNSNVRQFV